MRRVAFLEDQEAAHDHAGHRTERIERLRDVEPARAGCARPHQRRVRVRRRFQERQARGDHEQRDEEHPVLRHRRGREEQQAADRIQQQADEDRRLVAEFLHDGRGRNRDEEIAEIERGLHERRFEIGQEERFPELRDQHVVQVRRGAPQREQAAQQREREQGRAVQVIAVGCGFDSGSAHGCLLPGLSRLWTSRRGRQSPASRMKRSKVATSAYDFCVPRPVTECAAYAHA